MRDMRTDLTPTVTLTWHASKYSVHKLHQGVLPLICVCVCVYVCVCLCVCLCVCVCVLLDDSFFVAQWHLGLFREQSVQGTECSGNRVKLQSVDWTCRWFVLCGSNDAEVCSGHGECICGECDCFTFGPDTVHRYSGEYCECNDYSCLLSDDDASLCGGECSICMCLCLCICVCTCT